MKRKTSVVRLTNAVYAYPTSPRIHEGINVKPRVAPTAAGRPRMVDPLTIASGVSALVSNAYKLCFSISQTIDGIATAPRHIRAISRDLKAFYSVLGTLKAYLDDEEISGGVLHPATSADLEAVLTNCMTIFKDFNTIVKNYIKKSSEGGVTLARSGQWTWNEKEIWSLREHLAAHKITLNVAIAAANL
jgi:Fungal N-terminal domain of STAND proteins